MSRIYNRNDLAYTSSTATKLFYRNYLENDDYSVYSSTGSDQRSHITKKFLDETKRKHGEHTSKRKADDTRDRLKSVYALEQEENIKDPTKKRV